MVKKIILIIGLLLAIIVIGAIISFKPYFSPEPPALLQIEKGLVEINTGSSWQQAKNGTELKQGWQIRTDKESKANIIFFGDSVARLAENTEVIIKELNVTREGLNVIIKVVEGDVWHNIIPVSRINRYVVETLGGTFYKIGTSFGTSYRDGKAKTAVLSGSVTVRSIYYAGTITSMEQAEIIPRQPIKTQPLIKDGWVKENEQANIDWLIRYREHIKSKYSWQISLAKTTLPSVVGQEVTDEMINNFIDSYLRGEIDIIRLIEEKKIPNQFAGVIPPEFKVEPVAGPSLKKDLVHQVQQLLNGLQAGVYFGADGSPQPFTTPVNFGKDIGTVTSLTGFQWNVYDVNGIVVARPFQLFFVDPGPFMLFGILHSDGTADWAILTIEEVGEDYFISKASHYGGSEIDSKTGVWIDKLVPEGPLRMVSGLDQSKIKELFLGMCEMETHNTQGALECIDTGLKCEDGMEVQLIADEVSWFCGLPPQPLPQVEIPQVKKIPRERTRY